MDGKFIKKRVKVVAIPILTLIVAATQLSGCSSSSKSQVIDTVNEVGGDTVVEFKVEENEFTERGEAQSIEWVKLSTLNTYPEYRKVFEVNMGIEEGSGIKSGCVYIDADGNHTDNPTLLSAFSNKVVVEKFNNDEVQNYLRSSIQSTYADLEDSDEYAAIINAYFNLLPDSTPNYFNGGKSLSRLEAMTLVTRATTPVSTLTTDQAFTEAVGDTPYTPYASLSNSTSFISTSDNSLTQDNSTKAMSRGEYIYLIMSTIYGEDTINAVDLTQSKLTDVKDTTPTEHTKTNAEQLALALQTPTQAPELIYKALVLANENGIISAETDWNRAITKGEAIEFITEAIQAYNEKNGYAVDKDTALTETEAKAKAELEEKENILEGYEGIKDDVTCDEDTFYKEVKDLMDKEGYSIGEAYESVRVKYIKPVETTEPTTEKPTEQQTPPSDNSNKPSGNTGGSTGNTGGNNNSGGNTGNTGNNNNSGSTGNSGNNNSSGGSTGGNSGGGGTPTYVEPPQQQQTPPPTQPPVVTPPSSGGNNFGGEAELYDIPDDFDWSRDWEFDFE